jgi:hypothetical protein
MLTLKKIALFHLTQHGFGGLYTEGCACQLSDLMPCCTPNTDCIAGFKSVHSNGAWVIADSKGLSDSEIELIIEG